MNIWIKEQKRLKKKEAKFIKRQLKRKDNIVNQKLKNKVPEKLEETLNTAFEKAFMLIFSKGDHWIEKTYDRQKIKSSYTFNKTIVSNKPSKKNIRAFTKTTSTSSTKNVLCTGISSTLFGFLGIGLPDIPVLIGLIMRNLQEICLSYGLDPHKENEKIFMLMIIEGAISHETIPLINQKIDDFIHKGITPNLETQIQYTSKTLSHELLYLKFIQGIPVVGSISGVYDSIYMKRISEYAKLKYHYRFLLTK